MGCANSVIERYEFIIKSDRVFSFYREAKVFGIYCATDAKFGEIVDSFEKDRICRVFIDIPFEVDTPTCEDIRFAIG